MTVKGNPRTRSVGKATLMQGRSVIQETEHRRPWHHDLQTPSANGQLLSSAGTHRAQQIQPVADIIEALQVEHDSRSGIKFVQSRGSRRMVQQCIVLWVVFTVDSRDETYSSAGESVGGAASLEAGTASAGSSVAAG